MCLEVYHQYLDQNQTTMYLFENRVNKHIPFELAYHLLDQQRIHWLRSIQDSYRN